MSSDIRHLTNRRGECPPSPYDDHQPGGDVDRQLANREPDYPPRQIDSPGSLRPLRNETSIDTVHELVSYAALGVRVLALLISVGALLAIFYLCGA